MMYVWPVVILVTFLAVCYGLNRLWKRGEAEYQRVMLKDRLYQADAQLPSAGRFDVTWQDPTFAGASQTGQPPDTGPLLIQSELAAAQADLERSVRAMVREAEAKIPPRWRT